MAKTLVQQRKSSQQEKRTTWVNADYETRGEGTTQSNNRKNQQTKYSLTYREEKKIQ